MKPFSETEEFVRIAQMLQSVDPALDSATTHGKATIMLARMGRIEPQEDMLALCQCGWRGQIAETNERPYSTSEASWRMLAGRRGYVYVCPSCGAEIWRYYFEIN